MYALFPVEDEAECGRPNSGQERTSHGRRGVALILAIMVIFVMMLFTSDMIVSSQVNIELAVSHRDNAKAEYMAKSGFNLAMFLVSADFGLDLFLAGPQSPQKTPPTDTLGDIWSQLNGLPIGGATAEMAAAFTEDFAISKLADSAVSEQLKLFDGEFVIDVSDESSKINVNYCASGRCLEVVNMLNALFECTVERTFLEEKKLKGRELTGRIKDWIDDKTDAEPESGVADENDPYTRRNLKFRAKNAPLDSVDELKMVDGWDDQLHAIFSPFITAFPLQPSGQDKWRINLNTARREMLQCFFPEAETDCAESFFGALKARDDEKGGLGDAGSQMADTLRNKFCYNAGSLSPQDAANKVSWFSNRSSVFRIETKGLVGNREKKLVAVVERVQPKKDDKANSASFRVLHWRML